MKEKLNRAFSNMTMPDDCADRIQRAMRRKLRQKAQGRYVSTVAPGGKNHWGLAACLALLLVVGGGAWMLWGAPGGTPIDPLSVVQGWQTTETYNGNGYSLDYPQGWTVVDPGKAVIFQNPKLGRQALLVIEQQKSGNLEQRQDQEGFVLPSSEGFENLQIQSKQVVTLDGFTGGKVSFTYGPEHKQVVQYTVVEAGYIFTCNIPETNSEEYRQTLEGMVEGIRLDANPAPNPSPEGMSQYWDSSIWMLWPMEGWHFQENQGQDGRTLSFLDDESNGSLTISQGEAWIVNSIVGADGLRTFGPDEPENVQKSIKTLDGNNAAYSSFLQEGTRCEEYCVVVQGVGFIINCSYPEGQQDTLGTLMEEMVQSIVFFPGEPPVSDHLMDQVENAISYVTIDGIKLRYWEDWTIETSESSVSEISFTAPMGKAKFTLRVGPMDAVLESQGSRLDERGLLQISPDEGALLINPMKEILAGKVFASVSYIHGAPELLEMRYIGEVGNRAVGLAATCVNEEQSTYLPMLNDIIDSLSFTDENCWATQAMIYILEDSYLYLPDWAASEALGEEFWSQLLFMSFTSSGYYQSDDGTEIAKTQVGDAKMVTRDLGGYKERFIKISQEQAQEYGKLVTGKTLPELNIHDFHDTSNRVSPFYEDGFYYIAVSDFGGTWYRVKSVEYEADGNAVALFDILEEGENNHIGEARAVLAPADNSRGFTVVEKTTNWNPNGVQVTVYVPDNWVMNLVPKKVWVNSAAEQELFQTIIQELKMEGILENVELKNMTIQGEWLILDFDRAFSEQVNAAGLTGENIIIGSVVNSFLDAYPQCRSVTITVEGRSWESGHVVYDGPLTRRDPAL